MSDMSIEERIAARTDLAVAGATSVSPEVGGLSFRDMGQVMEFAKLMAVAGQAVPKHLRAAPGACLAVSLQALNWRMDPFAVANKSYAVNDRIAYEAQLIHAVIEQRAPIKGRIKGTVSGEGDKRKWTLKMQPVDDDEPLIFEGVEIGKITTKNSPLWKADPDQQLWYYTVRAMCRRHFPDVILGVYEKEEIEGSTPMRDVTPKPSSRMQEMVAKARGKDVVLSEDQRPAVEPEDVSQDPEDAETAEGHWTAAVDTEGAFPGSEAWDQGVEAAKAGVAREECPYQDDLGAAADWLEAYDQARRGAE